MPRQPERCKAKRKVGRWFCLLTVRVRIALPEVNITYFNPQLLDDRGEFEFLVSKFIPPSLQRPPRCLILKGNDFDCNHLRKTVFWFSAGLVGLGEK